MQRILWSFRNLLLIMILSSFRTDISHNISIDDFSTRKNWVSETIDPQQHGPIYHTGVWSDPYVGPGFMIKQGKGLFHFPKLETWVIEGFEYTFQQDAKTSDGFPEFEGENYLCCNIQNLSSEPVSLKFRLLDEINYTYHYHQETHEYEALEELVSDPETIIIQPNKPVQKVRIRLKKPGIKDSTVTNIVYKKQLKFIAFEVHRTIAPSKTKPTIDCTLAMDRLRLEDGTGSK